MTDVDFEFTHSHVNNLDMVLAEIIRDGLIKYRDTILLLDDNSDIYSIPSKLYPDNPSDVTEEEERIIFYHWIDLLNKMIISFNHEGWPNIEDYNFNLEFGQDGMIVDNQDELDRCHRDTNDHEAEVKYGRDLFIEYFDNLWI